MKDTWRFSAASASSLSCLRLVSSGDHKGERHAKAAQLVLGSANIGGAEVAIVVLQVGVALYQGCVAAMGTKGLMPLLSSELPLLHEQYKAGEKRVGLVIVDEVNGFATVGAGNSVSLNVPH